MQGALTVKLLLTFFVLDSATLASDRSTSSKIRDCRNGGESRGKSQEESRDGAQTRTRQCVFKQHLEHWVTLSLL